MIIRFGNCVLDTGCRELHCGEARVHLEPQVFDLLVHLIANRTRVVSKDELIGAIWGGRIVSDAAIAARINAARRAIGDTGKAQSLIRTIQRRGFRLLGEVCEVRAEPGVATAPDLEEPLALPDRPSIAVLAFENGSGGPAHEYFADGMADEIITALSRLKSVFVIARNSSFAYKGRSMDVRQIGRDLGVRYVLAGSVRRDGERLRTTAQLVDAASGGPCGPRNTRARSPSSSTRTMPSPPAWSRPSSRRCTGRSLNGAVASGRRISTPTISTCAPCPAPGAIRRMKT